MSDIPILHRGDRIHIVSPMLAESVIKGIMATYEKQGVKVIGWTELPGVASLRIVSIFRSVGQSPQGTMYPKGS